MAQEIWRLLEPNVDVYEAGDEYFHGESWYRVLSGIGLFVPNDTIYRRRVTIPDAVSATKGDTEKWKNQAEAWRSVYNELHTLCGIQPFRDGEGGLAMVLRLIRELHADASKWREHKCEPATSNKPLVSPDTGPMNFSDDPRQTAWNFERCITSITEIMAGVFGWHVPELEWQHLEELEKRIEGSTRVVPSPIPGMPDGWELDLNRAPCVVGFQTGTSRMTDTLQVPIRRITPPAPVCTFPKGVFPDGWLFSSIGTNWFSRNDPTERLSRGSNPLGNALDWLDDRIQWRPDLQPHEKIVRVGPEAEGGM